MAFTDIQKKALKAKLSYRKIKTRDSAGTTIAYVEGWHVVAEANRIFGFDSWDRMTLAPQCMWSEVQRGQFVCGYTTKVRIIVRAGDTITQREGIGTGFGRSPHRDVAHEIAIKASETDATKRALATFGNPFGLALYDRDQTQVSRPRERKSEAPSPEPLVLHLPGDRSVAYGGSSDFVAATLREIESIGAVDAIYAFWSANLDPLTDLRRRGQSDAEDPVETIITAFKSRVREVAGLTDPRPQATAADQVGTTRSPMLIPKENRIRDRGHLAFVARQPCLVCGRRPAQAHHIRYGHRGGMGLKPSDEFTVPLCNTHHGQLHHAGDERAWWARNGIVDPLKFANRLWTASRTSRPPDDQDEDAASADPASEPRADHSQINGAVEPIVSDLPDNVADGDHNAS